VLAALVLSLAAALATPPPQRLPGLALGAVLVWRVEIAAVVFAAGYAAIVTLRLALHGRTFTRVGSDGVEIPQVGLERAAAQTTQRTAEGLTESIGELRDGMQRLERRLDAIDDPHDLVLRSRRGGLA
jgi:hypothetical protein